jgi:hypothetical protein
MKKSKYIHINGINDKEKQVQEIMFFDVKTLKYVNSVYIGYFTEEQIKKLQAIKPTTK